MICQKQCAGDFLCVFPLSIDTGGIHIFKMIITMAGDKTMCTPAIDSKSVNQNFEKQDSGGTSLAKESIAEKYTTVLNF